MRYSGWLPKGSLIQIIRTDIKSFQTELEIYWAMLYYSVRSDLIESTFSKMSRVQKCLSTESAILNELRRP